MRVEKVLLSENLVGRSQSNQQQEYILKILNNQAKLVKTVNHDSVAHDG